MDFKRPYRLSLLTLICRLLPFYLKGKRAVLLLLAMLSPIKSLHDRFLDFAQKQHEEARFLPQVIALEEKLTTELSHYFLNPEDRFKIDLFAHKEYPLRSRFLKEKKDVPFLYNHYEYNNDEEKKPYKAYFRHEVTGSTLNHFNLKAPSLADPEKKDEYIIAIKSLINKFTMIRTYNIIMD